MSANYRAPMWGLFLFVVALAAAWFLTFLARADFAASPKFSALAAVVKLDNDKGHCSGTHVGNGYVLTAEHCADMQVLNARGDRLVTEVAFKDAAYDVAVLFADALADHPRAYVSCVMPKIEQEVVAAGNPGPLDFAVFHGRVAYRAFSLAIPGHTFPTVIGIDVTAMGGMSGGPVYVNGKVAAVTVAGPGYQLPTRGMFFATPLSSVCSKLPFPLT